MDSIRVERMPTSTGKRPARRSQHHHGRDELPRRRTAKPLLGIRRASREIRSRIGGLSRPAQAATETARGFHHEEQPLGCRTRPVVDTAPLLERDFARLAGLGWTKRNTMLGAKHGKLAVSRSLADRRRTRTGRSRMKRHTAAPAPALRRRLPDGRVYRAYVLDARRCISYLTDRTSRSADPRIVAGRHGQLGVWLRRLPGRLPLEPQGPAIQRAGIFSGRRSGFR